MAQMAEMARVDLVLLLAVETEVTAVVEGLLFYFLIQMFM